MHSRGLAVVLHADVAAIDNVGSVPGPGVAESVVQAALGTLPNSCLPVQEKRVLLFIYQF